MENFSPTGRDGFCLEDWIDSDTVATTPDPSNASSPFQDANTWDANAIATMTPSEQNGLYDASPSLSYQQPILSGKYPLYLPF
ncbi:hypothetical protein K435DRAFT_282826 [Dendrothele bispora CBS 962.96]|uniref:Uncharacterized protein n=1 Tax=Dendrothele bispora (strain CBS 962.96) TaxID=1314807 RepID=A0A4S8LLC7_DENBC|nr:hypothetical protein K435DRAFT_282826 [Dendrothele bispora CBS 962.96]